MIRVCSLIHTVGFLQLWREVLQGEVLPIADPVWREAHGGLAGGDSERTSHCVAVEARGRFAHRQRKPVPAEGPRGAG